MITATLVILLAISGFAILRLSAVIERLERAEAERVRSRICREPAPSTGRQFIGDVIGAALLSCVFLAAIFLAFAL